MPICGRVLDRPSQTEATEHVINFGVGRPPWTTCLGEPDQAYEGHGVFRREPCVVGSRDELASR
jgi:hypothetical protein